MPKLNSLQPPPYQGSPRLSADSVGFFEFCCFAPAAFLTRGVVAMGWGSMIPAQGGHKTIVASLGPNIQSLPLP